MSCLAPARGVRRTSSIIQHQSRLWKTHKLSRSWRFSQSSLLQNPYPAIFSEHAQVDRRADREFIYYFLENSPSKRDARAYLSQFSPWYEADGRDQKQPSATASSLPDAEREGRNETLLKKTGVNLGGLYLPGKAIDESPVFVQRSLLEEELRSKHIETLHVALVKIRQPQALDEHTLSGIGLTLSQLVRLGLNIVVVVDCEEDVANNNPEGITKEWKEAIRAQTDRIIAAVGAHSRLGAFLVNEALQCVVSTDDVPSKVSVRGRIKVQEREMILPMLKSGIVAVVPPIASSADMSRLQRVSADDIVLALTREFAGLHAHASSELSTASQSRLTTSENISLDKIIVLEPLGGIPSKERSDNAHIFINLEQEYDSVTAELSRETNASADVMNKDEKGSQYSLLGAGNPVSKFVEDEISPLPKPSNSTIAVESPRSSHYTRHQKNLDLIKKSLQLLPPASSALIITPSSAAISSQQPHGSNTPTAGVRTRLTKNPLIHNLLTDKPMVSSSLPISRFGMSSNAQATTFRNSLLLSGHPTFLKRGIPLTIIPDPRSEPWLAPGPEGTPMSLLDHRIDFSRLLHLIEDSFGRKLNVEHYLERIRNRLAGVIIAGEYEGGAICTWETPPRRLNQHDAVPTFVPYLDKFAVLRSSQGTGGVADIVFKALLRTCFPDGCVWRSRTSNPVNKWYFERSNGTWKLPGGKWTMFWTVEGGFDGDGESGNDMEKWRDYKDVCENIVPSWADNKPPD